MDESHGLSFEKAKAVLGESVNKGRRTTEFVVSDFRDASDESRTVINDREAYFINLEARELANNSKYELTDEQLNALTDNGSELDRELIQVGHWGYCRPENQEYGENLQRLTGAYMSAGVEYDRARMGALRFSQLVHRIAFDIAQPPKQALQK